MNGKERRIYIQQTLSASTQPITGTYLAAQCNVSRQVIVGDISLLRAQGINISSTPQGYSLNKPLSAELRRRIVCNHSADLLETELQTIIDNGGTVYSVGIEHDVYGHIEADLVLRSRRDINEFIARMNRTGAPPLLKISGGIHTHTIAAPSTELMDIIILELKRLNILYNVYA